MSKLSRRALASYGADRLLAGETTVKIAKQLVALLIESGRQGEADFLLEDIGWELERRKALTSARVTTARPLSSELEAELKKEIQKATGSDSVLLEEHVDRSVLGGVRIETASRVWDNTLSRKLSGLREVF